MRPDLRDLVDLVEVDGLSVRSARTPRTDAADPAEEPDGEPPSDAIVDPGPGMLAGLLWRWPWWRRADEGSRKLVCVTSLLVVVAIVAAAAAVRQPLRVEHRTRTVVVAAGPAGVDASGCPLTRRCALRRAFGMEAVLHTMLASLVVVFATELYDAETGAMYRRELLATSTAPVGTLRVVAQCVPGGVVTGADPVISRRSFTDDLGRRFVTVENTAVSAVSGCTAFSQAIQPAYAATGSGALIFVVLEIARDPTVLSYR